MVKRRARAMPILSTSARTRAMHASSSGSRKSIVPLICACICAPPSSSAEVFCPIAACTSAGPARKSPLPSVIKMWSHITGRYAPPATHIPMIAVICGMRIALITALLRKTRPKSSVSGNTSSCRAKIFRRNPPDRSWNMILHRDILRADHFFRGHREKRSGLHGRVVGDDHHAPPRTRARAQ